MFVGRYIAEQGRHPVERVLWIFLCLTGFGLAFIFLAPSQWWKIHSKTIQFPASSQTLDFLFFHCLLEESSLSGYDKYMNDPTTTGMETTDYPIWNIDFPGVTICPNTKVILKCTSKKNLLFLVGNEQVQGGIEKSKSPLGKTVEGCKCHAGAGN